MSAKLFYSYSDENRDLQKQIGCMNGLFQSFLGGRRVISQNHRRLPPGTDNSHGVEPKSASERKTAKELKKSTKEKQRTLSEPPRTSVSSISSCSTSYSYSDSKKTPQTSQRSLSQTNFPETPTRNSSIFKSNVSLPLSQSLDLRDVVKDSINRETRGLLVKTATKQEPRQQTLKYIDSPRPLQPLRSAQTRGSGPNESFQVAKLQEAPRNSNERRDGSLAFRPKDAPRFSYDERISHDTLKIKLKELPRLSLDSRVNRLKGELSGRNANLNDYDNQQEEPGSCRGPSSIVAKLMGLDDLPNSTPTIRNQTREIKTSLDVKDQSPRVDDGSRQYLISSSPRRASKESTSPSLRRAESTKTPTTGKCPIEPAPWKQSDLNKGQKPALKCKETPTKEQNSSLSVYGEIEKRLAQVEFKKSGKDLRALKQILEAMQKTKEMLDSRKGDQASNHSSQERTDSSLDQNSKFANLRILETSSAFSATSKGTSSPRNTRTAVMVMKPAKVDERARSPASSASTTDSATRPRTSDSSDHRREKVRQQLARELAPRRNNLRSPSSQSQQAEKNTTKSPRLIQPTKAASSTKQEIQRSRMGSDTKISLKQQQKKVEVEKPPHSTSESDQSIRSQLSAQQPDPSTPDEKQRHTSLKLQEYDHQMNGISYARYLSHQGDACSVKSESNMSSASSIEYEVSSIYKSGKINGTFFEQQNEKWKNPAVRLMDNGSAAEPLKLSLEQPSPVSVLDAAFYGDESPSPVKKISNVFKDDRYLIRDEAEWSSTNSNDFPDCKSPSRSLEHDCGKKENTQHLDQKTVHLESTHEEFIKEISPIYNSTNPDHKYISEILLASDIFRELESGVTAFQSHPSGHPINPSLYLALEQTKKNGGLSNDKRNGQRINKSEAIQKHHRKLVFDAVNEILASKLPSYNKCFSPNKLADRRLRGKQLMQDLCNEIDNRYTNNTHRSSEDEEDSLKGILWEDLTHQSAEWTSFQTELPLLVLDLERLIFKDLITEVVSGIRANLQVRPGGHCRQLFS